MTPRNARLNGQATMYGRPHHYSPQKRRSKFWLLVLAAAVVCAGGLWYAQQQKPSDEPYLRGDDALVRRLTKEHGAFELEPWLEAAPHHVARGMTNDSARSEMARLKSAGAVRILAFGQSTTAILAAELPTDSTARAQVFEWQERWQAQQRGPVVKDVGQKYILLDLPSDIFGPNRKSVGRE